LPHYIDRAAARQLHGAEPEVDDTWTFQGDIFHSLDLMVRRPGGAAGWPASWAITISHHCEWTKATKRPGMNYPILVAPLRPLDILTPSEQGLVRANRMFAYMLLPAEEPVDQDYAADLRLTQPFPAADLVGAGYVASLGRELWETLQAKVVEFITRDRTLA
jgi:hypothetical protein